MFMVKRVGLILQLIPLIMLPDYLYKGRLNFAEILLFYYYVQSLHGKSVDRFRVHA